MLPSNFLNICKIVARKCSIPGGGPSTVVDQIGTIGRVVDYVANAWADIQSSRTDWGFMWGTFNFTTQIGVDEYSSPFTADNVKEIKHPLKIYDTDTGIQSQSKLQFQNYLLFRKSDLGASAAGMPSKYTITPDYSTIILRSVPNKITYRIDGEAYMKAQMLGSTGSPNTEVPTIPEGMRWVIIWKAVMLYAAHEEYDSLYRTSLVEFNREYNNLVRDYVVRNQVPTVRCLA